jgi:hypothetical protein
VKNNRHSRQVLIKTAKIILPLVIVVSSLLLIPAAAFAQTPEDISHDLYPYNSSVNIYLASDEDTTVTIDGSWGDRKVIHLKGKGTLEAEGEGICRIKGSTNDIDDGIITVSGNGVLVVRDIEGDMEKSITGYGGKVEIKENYWIYYGFNGSAEIKGGSFIVSSIGDNIDFYAKGRGIIHLAGKGSYTAERTIDGSDEDFF